MKKIVTIIFLVFTILFACKKTSPILPPVDDQGSWTFDVLSADKELFLKNDSSSKGLALRLEFNYPSQYVNDSVLKMIQSSFIVAFTGEKYQDKTPNEAFDLFLKKVAYEFLQVGELARDDGTDFSDYYKKIATSVFDTTDVMITAKTIDEDYMGGAHGSNLVSYYNISLKDGQIKKESDLFKKKYEKPLAKLMRKKLKDLIEQGKMITVLDESLVKPNGNFYFDERGLVYVFNRGDIAPYSDGIIEISISYFDIKKLVNPEFETWITPKIIKTE